MNRLPAVDALRGLAALWVVLLHCFHQYGAGEMPSPGLRRAPAALASVGYLGVQLFLVISGFCLTFPLARRAGPGEWRVDGRQFLAARAWRILPPYYATLLVCAAALHLFGPQPLYLVPPSGAADTAAHAVLVHNLSPATIWSYNPVFWSLALEWQLYLLFPLVLWSVRRVGPSATVALALALSVAWAAGARAVAAPVWEAHVAHAAPARLFTFCLGVLAARLVAAPGPRTRRQAGCAAAVLLPAAVWSSWPAVGPIDWAALYTPLQHWLWPAVFAGLLVWACLSRFPGWLRPLDFLGARSYSLYLVHPLVLVALRPPLRGVGWEVAAAVAVPAAVAVSLGYYAAVEWPFLRLKARLSGRRASTASPVGGQPP